MSEEVPLINMAMAMVTAMAMVMGMAIPISRKVIKKDGGQRHNPAFPAAA